MSKALENLRADDDGLPCPEVRWWAETKYRLISLYDQLFAEGMKNKWDMRIYIDLYAGAGYSHIQDTNIRLKGSPVLALSVSTLFDKYIFCEQNQDLLSALRIRSDQIAPSADITYISGNCDDKIQSICDAIPRGSSTNSVLSLCLVDPFDFGFKFQTIKRLATKYVDFLVLLAVGMDANRAYEHYVEGRNPKLDEALGNTAWRERWNSRPRGRDEFLSFIAEEFALSMSSLGYLKIRPSEMKLVRSDEKNLPLYYLALFSKSRTAYQFWDQVLKYGTDQMGFSWG